MIIKSHRTREGHTAWVDTDSDREAALDAGGASESERREQAARVYRRRIHGLLEDRERLLGELEEARAQLHSREQEALEAGRRRGLDEGRAVARRELEESFSLIGMLQAEFRRAAEAYHRDSDRQLVRLARWMAERVLSRELPLDAERLQRTLRELLDYWVAEQVYRFRLHPDDRVALTGMPELHGFEERSGGRLEWVDSPEIPRGSCRLELSSGVVDALPEEMLRYLEERLLSCLTEAPLNGDSVEDRES